MTKINWTVESYAAHNEAMRIVEDRFQSERDRRYTEVNIEKEKALKIKETADLAALSLARESQTYKEQQNDALRDKNLAESGVYATNSSVSAAIDATNANFTKSLGNLESKFDTTLQPIVDFISGQKGASQGSQITMGKIYATLGAFSAVLGIIIYLVSQISK